MRVGLKGEQCCACGSACVWSGWCVCVCDLDIHPSETYTLVYLSQTSLYRFHDGGGWERLTRGTVSARSGQREAGWTHNDIENKQW